MAHPKTTKTRKILMRRNRYPSSAQKPSRMTGTIQIPTLTSRKKKRRKIKIRREAGQESVARDAAKEVMLRSQGPE